jgi:hypothetical protein
MERWDLELRQLDAEIGVRNRESESQRVRLAEEKAAVEVMRRELAGVEGRAAAEVGRGAG